MGQNKVHTRKIWKDKPDKTTPINASELNRIEDTLDVLDDSIIEIKDAMINGVNTAGFKKPNGEIIPLSVIVGGGEEIMEYMTEEEITTVSTAMQTYMQEHPDEISDGNAMIRILSTILSDSLGWEMTPFAWIYLLFEQIGSNDSQAQAPDRYQDVVNSINTIFRNIKNASDLFGEWLYPYNEYNRHYSSDPVNNVAIIVAKALFLDIPLMKEIYMPYIPQQPQNFVLSIAAGDAPGLLRGAWQFTNPKGGLFTTGRLFYDNNWQSPNQSIHDGDNVVIIVSEQYSESDARNFTPIYVDITKIFSADSSNRLFHIVNYVGFSPSTNSQSNVFTYGDKEGKDDYISDKINHFDSEKYYRFGVLLVQSYIIRAGLLNLIKYTPIPNEMWYPVAWDKGIYSIDTENNIVNKIAESEVQ